MTRHFLDPYRTLGVASDATHDQIARAYRRLAKALHPDVAGDASGERMRLVNAAWEILSDPGKKAAWDAGRAVLAAGTHWRPATAAPAWPHTNTWVPWPSEPGADEAPTHSRRPPAGERRLSDSPWILVGIVGAVVIAILGTAGIASIGDRKLLTGSFEGFQNVSSPPHLNHAVAGGAIEVRFAMRNAEGGDLLAEGSPTSRRVACEEGEPGPADVLPSILSSNSNFRFDQPGHRYIYTWQTDLAWADTCRKLVITFRDGSSREAWFDFRR